MVCFIKIIQNIDRDFVTARSLKPCITRRAGIIYKYNESMNKINDK